MERLFSLLDHGFWMTIPEERLTGLRNGDRPTSLSYSAPMTCFTELRLSAAQAHHLRYGLLGLVVDRGFVLERWGAPVHYVRSHEEDAIAGNLVMLLSWIQQQIDRGVEHADTIMTNMRFLIGFTKNMSDLGTDNFLYLDEQEWRIVHSYRQQELGRIHATGKDKPKYLMPFTRSDIQMLVVPDSEIRTELLASVRFSNWAGAQMPPILTSEEIEQF